MSGSGERLRLFDENPIGLGCWALSGKNWGGQSESASMEAMEAAFEAGVRHFDTARGYGVSELLVGRFLSGRRESVFLASKVFPNRGPEGIREHLNRSLDSLQTDYLDLYYLHYPVCRDTMEGQMAVLLQAREDGLIRHVGVSNYSVEDLQRVPEAEFFQVGYNALWRQPEAALLPYCREAGIRVVAYSPLGQGVLTGKFSRHPAFPKGDNRPRTIPFREDIWPSVHEAVEAMKPLAREAGCTLGQLALKWCLSREGIAAVVAGARNAGQARENAHAGLVMANPAILEEVTRIWDPLQERLPRLGNFFGVAFT